MDPQQIVTYVPVALWLAALIGACIAVWFAPRPVTLRLAADKLLRYLFIFPLGVQGLWAFFGHVFLPEDSAAAIGWAPSPFQFEVGVANLGLALACFYAAFAGFEARLAAALAASCFLIGAGVIHIVDIIDKGNFAPGNAGPIMFTDFLTPIVVLSLLVAFPPLASASVAARARQPAAQPAADKTSPPPRAASAPRIQDELEQVRKSMRELGPRPAQEARPGSRQPPRRRGPGRTGE
jgi:hypothetical protein